MISWLLLSTAWSCKRFWYIILAEILCCLNSLKSDGRSENNSFLNFTSLLMMESWSCSESLWILLYILFTCSWEETGALYLKRFPFSIQRANALFFVCSLARISDSVSEIAIFALMTSCCAFDNSAFICAISFCFFFNKSKRS